MMADSSSSAAHNMADGIAKMAANFQKRASDLQTAQANQTDLRQQLEQEQQKLQEHRALERSARKEALRSTRHAAQVELEQLEWEEKVCACRDKDTVQLVQATEELEERLRAAQDEWEQTVEATLWAQHKTKQELYCKTLQEAITKCEEAKQARLNKLEFLRTAEFDTEGIRQHQKQVEEDMRKFVEKQKADHAQVQVLANQVREALQRVSSHCAIRLGEF